MKDLLLYAADADTQAFLGALLSRHRALGIRPLKFETDRHPGRDSGMVQSGPELLRMRKGRHAKVIVALDYHGSGRERRQDAAALTADLQRRLDSCTWTDNSCVLVIEPELERWLWCAGALISKHCGLTERELLNKLNNWVESQGIDLEQAKRQRPKELFEAVIREDLRRTISPRDFQLLGEGASVRALGEDATFQRLLAVLRAWFPAEANA